MALKSLLLELLSRENVARLSRIRKQAASVRHARNLIRLGQIFQTDKWGNHWYLQHYETHFRSRRTRRLNLLEIGIGGYSDPGKGGNSLKTWKAYFPNANIFGIDIFDKRGVEEGRIKTFQGSQVDEQFLKRVVEEIGGVDIVIDDGSHINSDVIRTFAILFPLLRRDGIYAVEDTQTSYWPGFGGSSEELNSRATIMGYFASLLHSLNHQEILKKGYAPTEFDRSIVGMHFYHNLILVCKGENSETSNLLEKNWTESRIVFEGLSAEGT